MRFEVVLSLDDAELKLCLESGESVEELDGVAFAKYLPIDVE